MKMHVEVCHARDVGYDCPLSPRTSFAIPSQRDVHAMTIRLILYNTCISYRGDPLRRYALLQYEPMDEEDTHVDDAKELEKGAASM